MPAHDPDVPYADVVLTSEQVDLTGWECWAVPDADMTRFYAGGPCPVCGARAQGSISEKPAPVESLGRGQEEVEPPSTEPVEVPVRCSCGSPHGHDGATSCGRRWSIICPRDPT
jgi:hypothetical protein